MIIFGARRATSKDYYNKVLREKGFSEREATEALKRFDGEIDKRTRNN